MKKTIIATILCCFALALAAQPYSLETLVEHGVENATAIRQQLLDELSTRSSLTSSFHNFLPQASVSYSYSESDVSASYTSSLSISKSVSLQDSDWYEYRRQYIYLAMAELSLEALRKQIACTVVSQYLGVIEAERTGEILTAQYAIEQKTHEQTQILFDTDKRSLLDLKQSEINLIDARIAMENQAIVLATLRQNLFNLLNLEDMGWALADPGLDLEPLALSWQKPLAVRLEEEGIDADRISLRESFRRFMPNLTLSASWSYGASGPDAGDPIDSDLLDDSYSLGLTAKYNLLNFLTHGQTHRRQKWAMRRRMLGLEDMLQQKRLEFEQQVADWNHLRSMHDLYIQKLELAADNHEMAQEKYRLGMLSFLDTERVRLDYFQAQITVNRSHFNLLRQREELNLLLSRPILGRW
ncbi:MAG: TolC family protein [Candidatus Cloacimonetes bacterium]|nr:TolC family protein [Candidatus Cloacimonadota bacterium]